jgi:hypothetical protein
MILRFRTLFGFLTLLSLFSCGGGGSLTRDDIVGGGNAGGGGTTTITRSISLVFTDADGQSSTSLSESTPLTLTATAIDSNGDPVVDTLITYTFQPEGLAVFGNDSGTASTDSSGVATLEILVGENSGAGEIVASLSSGETATTTFNSEGTTLIGEQPASLDLFGSSTQLASSGSDVIELTALVKDANNVLLEGIDVTFSANAAASLRLANGGSIAVTGADGVARATLSTQNNQENRIIEVTANTAVFSQVLEVQVVGTQININGSSSAILNDPVPLTISLVDSDGNGIANQVVTLNASNGQLSDTSPVTSAEGQITVNYTGDMSGADTVTATALNSINEFSIAVQEDDFSFVDGAVNSEAQVVNLNTATELAIEWLKNGSPFVNGAVTLTSSRGVVAVATANTGSSGNVTFSIQSDNAGFATITATGVDADENEVSARTLVEFVATVADSIIVDGTPDSVAPSGQTSTITSVVRDPNGNLVKGKLINFVVDDVSGGTISPNQATTDRSGIASTVYTSNAVSSFEAVKVYATVSDTPSVSDFTSLTVGDRAFDISIGTGRLIEAPEQSSYSKEFSVFVTDPDSNPVPNALLTFSATPVRFLDGGVYRKGFWAFDTTNNIWFRTITATCPNEDIDGNGILDEGEDFNNDGQLTPGNVVSIPSTSTTDVNGQTLVNLLYAKQFGAWVDVDIIAKGESAGSESSESQKYSLVVATEDLSNEASPPPNSPFGFGPNCNDTN